MRPLQFAVKKTLDESVLLKAGRITPSNDQVASLERKVEKSTVFNDPPSDLLARFEMFLFGKLP